MKLHHLPALALAATVAIAQVNAETTATTDPVGFVTVGVNAGTGIAKVNTLFSLPLLENDSINGQAAGRITGITATSISNADAGWTAGALSNPAMPYLIQITSGAAAGRLFLISSSAATGGAIAGTANTATTVTISSIDSTQVDLTTLGIQTGEAGDTYRIHPADTLNSFFGTPENSGVLGGASAAVADTVVVVYNGAPNTYWYNTSASRWARVGPGSPDASNVALLPYYGYQFQRLANTPLSFVVTGAVPVVKRAVGIRDSGLTLLSQYWPVDSTLASVGLQALPGWTSAAASADADTVIIMTGSTANTYWYNGTNWRRVGPGNPISDTASIPIGATIQITKKGVASSYTTLAQEVPYEL